MSGECLHENSCPAVKELRDGSFLVIGKRADPEYRDAAECARHLNLPVGDDEHAVFVPRSVVLDALGLLITRVLT